MTGFGRAEAEFEGHRITVEIRSLNHRFCEILARLPKGLAHLESRVRDAVQDRVQRGKIVVAVSLEGQNDGPIAEVQLNEAVAQRYLDLAHSMKTKLRIQGDLDLQSLFGLPDVVTRESEKIDEESYWAPIREAVLGALDDLDSMRNTEGEALAKDLLHRTAILEGGLERIEARIPEWLSEGKQRLEEKVNSLTQDGDFNRYRLEAEIVLFVDRFDATEECVRLRSHIEQMRSWIGDPAPAGRKLNFLLQEVNREVNTIGSKAQDITLAKEVVLLKEEVEKIREQIQNVE
jgi:uncharacterized protein (TIGR00255 family)